MNKQHLFGIASMLLGAMALAACADGSDDDVTAGIDRSEPITFSTDYADTRADNGELTNMPSGSRFAIRMYYDTRVTSTLTDLQFTANETSAMTVGDDGKCSYNDGQPKFYWTNRKYHGFIALAENTDLTTTPAASDALTFAMTDQKDPLLAVAKKQPTGGNNEANRVTLTFQHQFAKVQVNIKADGVTVSESDNIEIESITLCGVASEATVYPVFSGTSDTTHVATAASEATMDYTMPLATTAETGYLKTSNCIAFGKIGAIKVVWYEIAEDKTRTQHTATYTFKASEQEEGYSEVSPTLESGKKYIYNLSMRRGTIAVVNAVIVDWGTVDTSYSQDGIINSSSI